MTNAHERYHIPVLLEESINGLNIQPDGIYVDVTYGGGGHSREILSKLDRNGHLYSFDQDEDAEQNIVNDDRFTFVRSNFRYLKNWMRYYGVKHIDGLIADLGVSSHHFDTEERGFSFRFDTAPLDMRMNRKAGKTAADVLNEYNEQQLANIFYLYGEVKESRRIAREVIKQRNKQPFVTIQDFAQVASPLIRKEKEKKSLAQLFQALRIEVNQEMKALQEMLYSVSEVIRPGGRLVVITYHSIEDRMVKNIMKSGNIEGVVSQDFFGRIKPIWKAINNKIITPSEEEIASNPRSRSAKLRIAERT